MLLLTLPLLLILTVGLIVFGRTTSTEETFFEALDIQMEVFEKDICTHFDHLAASAITLSEDMTLKYHNHNILGKLGVSSRKQMLRYAEVMRNQKEEDVT